MARGDEDVIGRFAEPLAHQVAHALDAERLRAYRHGREVVDQVGQQSLDVVSLTGAQGGH
jgi:hypothetical protein